MTTTKKQHTQRITRASDKRGKRGKRDQRDQLPITTILLRDKVRDYAQRLTILLTLADHALEYAEANYKSHPRLAAERLSNTLTEVCALIPPHFVLKVITSCRKK